MKKLGEADLFPLLVVARYLDDRILYHLCTINMEEAARGMEIITRYFSDFTAEQIGSWKHWKRFMRNGIADQCNFQKGYRWHFMKNMCCIP